MKTTYAENPDQALHVWVPGDGNGDWSIYPWSSQAATATGGSMVMAQTVGGETCGPSHDQHCTWMTHEVGHALGLWHTFDVPEGGSNNACNCTERAVCMGGVSCSECDHVGDLCCDTPSGLGAGLGGCSSVSGTDSCSSNASYPTADYTNYMDYGGDGCADHFTAQQAQRMHCWVCNAVPGWIDSPDCNSNGIPDVCEITRGNDLDCDEDGMLDDACDTGGACCLSGVSGDCIKTPSSACCDAANGLHWYGLGTKCRDIDCFEGPMGPQGP